MTTLAPGIYQGMPDDEYFALPFVSHSDLQAFAAGESRKPISKANAQAGHLAELFALEPTSYAVRYFTLPDDLDDEGHQIHKFNTKDGKAWLAEHQKANVGLEPVRYEEREKAQKRGNALLRSGPTSAFFQYERNIQTVIVTELDGVMVKVRLDMEILRDGDVVIGDLKTTSALTAEEFRESIVKYGYASQAAIYCDAYAAATGITPRDYYNIVVSKTGRDDDGWPATWRVHYTAEMLAYGRRWYQDVLRLKGKYDNV